MQIAKAPAMNSAGEPMQPSAAAAARWPPVGSKKVKAETRALQPTQTTKAPQFHLNRATATLASSRIRAAGLPNIRMASDRAETGMPSQLGRCVVQTSCAAALTGGVYLGIGVGTVVFVSLAPERLAPILGALVILIVVMDRFDLVGCDGRAAIMAVDRTELTAPVARRYQPDADLRHGKAGERENCKSDE